MTARATDAIAMPAGTTTLSAFGCKDRRRGSAAHTPAATTNPDPAVTASVHAKVPVIASRVMITPTMIVVTAGAPPLAVVLPRTDGKSPRCAIDAVNRGIARTVAAIAPLVEIIAAIATKRPPA